MARAIPYAGVMLAVAPVTAPAGARQTPGAAPGDELPDGEGKKILVAACTSCHDLGEVTKFDGYWDREQWRAAVVTMVEYGAERRLPARGAGRPRAAGCAGGQGARRPTTT